MSDKPVKGPQHFPAGTTAPVRFRENTIEGARRCTKCGKIGRVISNNHGVSVKCVCGYRWPISSSALNPPVPMMPDRGFSKHTVVEPDWNKAFAETGGVVNEPFGPQSK
jgi:hypothetical protein